MFTAVLESGKLDFGPFQMTRNGAVGNIGTPHIANKKLVTRLGVLEANGSKCLDTKIGDSSTC